MHSTRACPMPSTRMPSAVSWRSARKSTLHGRRDRASPIGIGTAQARAVRQRGAGRCVIGELLVQLVALLIDREIERRLQRHDLLDAASPLSLWLTAG